MSPPHPQTHQDLLWFSLEGYKVFLSTGKAGMQDPHPSKRSPSERSTVVFSPKDESTIRHFPNGLGIKFKFSNFKELSKSNSYPDFLQAEVPLVFSPCSEKEGLCSFSVHSWGVGKQNKTKQNTYPEPDALPIAVDCVSSKPNALWTNVTKLPF